MTPLIDNQRVGQQRLAEPAVLLTDREAEQPHLLHAVDDRVGELVLVLEFRRVRQDLLVDEVLDGADDLELDVGESGGLGEAGHAGPPGSVASAGTSRRDAVSRKYPPEFVRTTK
jgi:hypothetical protein